ncbi:hypothetical protein UF75_2785 [Desulfosporosinus sp. I2]|nr:hypothetical protein UF75_2785 [Desulfosporosinus sp. I2]
MSLIPWTGDLAVVLDILDGDLVDVLLFLDGDLVDVLLFLDGDLVAALLFLNGVLSAVLLESVRTFSALSLQYYCVQNDPKLSPFLSVGSEDGPHRFDRPYLNDFSHLFP